VTPCATCGFPKYRPDAHADWCERVAVALRDLSAAADMAGAERGGLVRGYGPERGRALYAERIAARQVTS
jgi:hypothetical protein